MMNEAASVKMPYAVIGMALLLLAVLIGASKLPQIEAGPNPTGDKTGDSIWKHPNLTLAAIGIFSYVGAEVSIGSAMTNFLHEPDMLNVPLEEAGKLVSYYWGGAMVGRFIGSGLLTMFRAHRLLAVFALGACLLCLAVTQLHGSTAAYLALSIGLFNSIMFPVIFTLTLERSSAAPAATSGLLCLSIVGGAILPYIYGLIADAAGLHTAYFLPAVAYAAIALIALAAAGAKIYAHGTTAASAGH